MNQRLSQEQCTSQTDILQALIDGNGSDLLEILRLLLNSAMVLERTQHLNATQYQRTTERTGYANGYKPKQYNTRLGSIDLAVPQTRDCDFYPSVIERGQRSERALNCAIAEMYIQGVSTRKVDAILEKLCNFNISSSQVSRITAELDDELEKWRNRQLGHIEYMLLDARYEKVRVDKVVRDCALCIAYGIDVTGRKTVLGVSVELSEAEVHWRNFMESLANRGLSGLKMITSDAHVGLQAARMKVFPSVPWQRCQFHLQQNASAYIPKKSMQLEVHGKIKAIFNAPDEIEATRLLQNTANLYRENASDLANWLEENIPEGFTVFGQKNLNEVSRRKLRTTNMVEFQNKELKKRTRVVKIFTNTDSLLRLSSALLMELDEKWQTEEKRYIKIE